MAIRCAIYARYFSDQQRPEFLRGVEQLTAAVNARLRARRPEVMADRDRLREELRGIQKRLEGIRGFVEAGDRSPKVRRAGRLS